MPTDIKPALKKFIPHLLQAQKDNLNEADTVLRITKFFEDVLGYDALQEISREANLKGKYVDIAIKIDGVIRLLIEAKAAGVVLRDRHIEQAEAYASRNNYRWVLLTNGVAWNLYHLTFEEGIEYEKVFTVDVSTDSLDVAADKLGLLARAAVKRDEHEAYWDKVSALTPAAIGKCLFREDVLMLLRREIRREHGTLIDAEDLATAIHGMLSQEARELIGPRKIYRKRQRRTEGKKAGSGTAGESPDDQEGATEKK